MKAANRLFRRPSAANGQATAATCRRFGRLAACVLLLAAVLCGCKSLPDLSSRTESRALPALADGKIQTAWQIPPAAQSSHILLLADARDAFVARAVLFAQAERSLDLAYYIWHDDVSGRLLMSLLQQAAQRGVRVRLLLDDNNTRGMDDLLAALDAEANLEIRLFNPFLHRKLRALGYLTDFPRLNRRMHNKSLVADGKLALLGGRNIGDEYFLLDGESGFADLDILAAGRITGEVSADFDRYWNSASSYPFGQIAADADAAAGAAVLAEAAQQDGKIWQHYRTQVLHSPLFLDLAHRRLKWHAANARLLSDPPEKALARGRESSGTAEKLHEAVGTPEREMYIVSPYFVPADDGVAALAGLSRKGVRVNILTNSLAATDVAAVHSGYARYRKPLLENGIGLYELKPDYAPPKSRDRGLTGSSVTSLHAKTLVADGKKMYVGSLNFDPRSARLNTESGIVIENAALVGRVQRSLTETTPQHAYRVVLEQGRLKWHAPPPEQTVHEREPEAGFWKRLGVGILSVLPIENLL